ncbi:MAG TPA: UDP-N-acetylmuramate dehydrogenase [Rhodanobacteraceae bacterium]|jgi:UDP-N-acetylmuramate dehydrogenase|nr:UDP-N-acetylmuramate dehydrogenase [Rhodanobacteraceae bacterium]
MAIESAPVDLGGYTLREDASLRARNTLRVDARATLLAEVRDTNALMKLLDWPAVHGMRTLVLGQGSNVLFAGDFAGLVVTLKTSGIEILDQDERSARVRIAAGEHWNDVVRWSLAHGLCGLENLSLIPGTAGAAPVQNIGAYGVELETFVHAVKAFDLREHRTTGFTKDECTFAYRDSRFKREPDRWLITSLELDLPKQREPVLDYAGVREELATMGVEAGPTSAQIAEAVVRLRTRKLPDPALIPNAGSFFKNPIVARTRAEALKREHPTLPLWPMDATHAKLSAAWLIEAAGFKGVREGDAGISERHALVLVNHGGATGAQLWALAQRVREGVLERFGVTLEPEPRVIAA